MPQIIDAFKLWLMWKARGDSGLHHLTDNVMELAEYTLQMISSRQGFRLVSNQLQCPNVCFWYIPKFMRNMDENEKWWDLMHRVTPKVKELLTLSSRLMIAYSPLRHFKNFFRLALTFHPRLEQKDIVDMIEAIEECGESVQLGK